MYVRSISSNLTSGKSPPVGTLEHLTATRNNEGDQILDESNESKRNKKKTKKKSNSKSKDDKRSQPRSDSHVVDDSKVNKSSVRMVAAEVQVESVAVVVKEENEEDVDVTDGSKPERRMKSVSSRFVYDNDLILTEDKEGITVRPKTSSSSTNIAEKAKIKTKTEDTATSNKNKSIAKFLKEEVPKPVLPGSFNVVLTHCTADFDTLASAVGLAKLWSTQGHNNESVDHAISTEFQTSQNLPTFVVLPRGAHPAVQKFLSLHKHLFPIRSLKSLPNDLSGLNRLGLVDAQRRDRVGPAEHLISHAKRVTIVDHHIDGESDIVEATDYVVEKVGSVSTMIAERLRSAGLELTEAEATLLALGIHADTGSLVFDSTTPRDAEALSWVMAQGASQAAIAEHVHSTLSQEQQGVLTNALINTNSTIIHGVTISTVLLSADGFINGLAAVTQDALELSSSDVFLLAVVYDPKAGGKGKGKGGGGQDSGIRLQSKLFTSSEDKNDQNDGIMTSDAWKGGEKAFQLKRLRAAFDKKDTDGSGYLEANEISNALAQSGIISTDEAFQELMSSIDTDGDGRIDFDEFVNFSERISEMQANERGRKPSTMIVIGRVKAGINMKNINLNHIFHEFGGGGHAKAASCTVRLDDEADAEQILQRMVDDLIDDGLTEQLTVGDFMTSPVLSAKPDMTEKQVEDLFIRYDVRALPVVDDRNEVIGLVTYKEVAAAKQRLWNKEQKKMRQQGKNIEKISKGRDEKGDKEDEDANEKTKERKLGSPLKGWMKQKIQTVEDSMTMAEVEALLLETDIGCIPVVSHGTKQLVGMVTRTDLLRQHRYYPSLHYHNPGFSDSIAARKPIIELRKKLKQFDLENE